MKKYIAAGLAALGIGLSGSGISQAASLADTYSGKTVTLVFGFSVGGTYGQYSMLLAQFLPEHIPGKPNIITQSMPGAGGLKASNYAYNIMPKNGLAIFMPPDSIVVNQLLRPKGVRYKANGFTWLGNVIESNSIIAVTKRSGIKTFEDALKREVIMGSTGKGSQTFLVPKMLNGVFGAKFKIIMGYKGARGSTHAMELGETQGVSLTWLTLKRNRSKWFDSSSHPTKGVPILQVGFRSEPDLKGVPMANEIAKTKEDRQIVNFIASLGPIGRGLAMPPGVPKEITAGLTKSFEAMVSDPKFIAEVTKRRLKVQPKSGPEVQAIVEEVLQMSPALVERARKVILGG